jgi:hypothetical protein
VSFVPNIFCRHLINFQFPADFPKILLVGIVERTCLKTVIREIPGITDCFSAVVKDRGVEKIRVGYFYGSTCAGS